MAKQKEGTESKRSFSRRQVLKLGALAGAGLVLSSKLDGRKAGAQEPEFCPEMPANLNLTPFVDDLPIPPTLSPAEWQEVDNMIHYNLAANQFLYSFHRDLPSAPVWGFNGITPGPTIETLRNQRISVTIANNLESYILCPDSNVHGTWPVPYLTIHGHGLIDRPEHDGFPENRFPPGVSYTYEYPNIQGGGTFWYHDHNLGVTRIAVMSGLAGFYLIRERYEWLLFLPKGEFEIPLVIQDKSFNSDGSIWEWSPWQPEFFGQYATVNGKVWPKLNVKRGKYRFRILNGANARFFNLTLNPSPPPGAFMQIGTEGGFLPKPVDLTDPDATPMQGLLLAPAERADVIVDFSVYPPGTEIIMTNNAPAPFPGGGEVEVNMVMKFIVGSAEGWRFPIPQRLPHLPVVAAPIKERFLTLVDFGSPVLGYPAPPPDYPYPTLLLNNLRFSDPPTETPAAGSTEIWNLINLAPDTHPIHLHQTQFRILSRRDFHVREYLLRYGVDGPVEDPDIPFTGDPMPPYPFEDGLKDTVRANPGQVARIEVPFGPFRGRFVWHCHILDHEDNEMMRSMLLV